MINLWTRLSQIASFLGFLSSGDQVLSGNRALHDILAALHMLHNVAPDFNGDPTRISLLGFGSGAVLVNLLMTAPPSFREWHVPLL